MGFLRSKHPPYTALSVNYARKITVEYDFAENNQETIWLNVVRVRHLTAGQTKVDHERRWNKLTKKMDREAKRQQAELEAEQAAEQQEMFKDIASQKNAADHQADRAAWQASGIKKWEDWLSSVERAAWQGSGQTWDEWSAAYFPSPDAE